MQKFYERLDTRMETVDIEEMEDRIDAVEFLDDVFDEFGSYKFNKYKADDDIIKQLLNRGFTFEFENDKINKLIYNTIKFILLYYKADDVENYALYCEYMNKIIKPVKGKINNFDIDIFAAFVDILDINNNEDKNIIKSGYNKIIKYILRYAKIEINPIFKTPLKL